jgi:hypothetical protein
MTPEAKRWLLAFCEAVNTLYEAHMKKAGVVETWFFWFCHTCKMTVVTGKKLGDCPGCHHAMELRFFGEFEVRSGEQILSAISSAVEETPF